jgi:ABC-type antimicrobial peptide transport system permease subunit
VRALVLTESLTLAGFGAAIGLLGASGATRVLRNMVYDVNPLDPTVLGAAALLLVAGSVLASAIPMYRATRVDALAVLRS